MMESEIQGVDFWSLNTDVQVYILWYSSRWCGKDFMAACLPVVKLKMCKVKYGEVSMKNQSALYTLKSIKSCSP